jgi:16S rRNA U516 pseudouridylate synthase RsuA-like enzyme
MLRHWRIRCSLEAKGYVHAEQRPRGWCTGAYKAQSNRGVQYSGSMLAVVRKFLKLSLASLLSATKSSLAQGRNRQCQARYSHILGLLVSNLKRVETVTLTC